MDNEELLNRVDAMVFSGDSLYDKQNAEQFDSYLKRWRRELSSIQEPMIENPIKIIKHNIAELLMKDLGQLVYWLTHVAL